jgi:hypothetical protein
MGVLSVFTLRTLVMKVATRLTANLAHQELAHYRSRYSTLP